MLEITKQINVQQLLGLASPNDKLQEKLGVDDFIVGSMLGNKNFQGLELCIVSSKFGSNAKI
ncbi:hypothetical protein BGZ92_007663, partial [Podila epicladia]